MSTTLPWFNAAFPLYLAPMAGVSDKIFRQICKRYGADVLVTEFVSAEGIFRRNERTRQYLDFDDRERPLGVQLFGANPAHMAQAAKQVVDWVGPDFIDLNFGCPVNKVVAKNGGSALLKDCPTLSSVAKAVVRAVAPLPVTAKIRIGWDANSINAVRVAEILQECGIAALAVHGRTRAQGYSGEADWRVIGEVAEAVTIPVIGNGDLFSAQEVARRRTETKIAGVMIGRAAMSAPWIFRQIKYYLVTGEPLPAPELSERWNVIIEHCRRHADDWGDEEQAIRSMRAHLMAYSKNFPEAKALREKFQHVSAVAEIEDIAEAHQRASREWLLPNASPLRPGCPPGRKRARTCRQMAHGSTQHVELQSDSVIINS
ncbi:MAG: tRNA dihydrouridine synthase DusB [Verrucomicrobia bacterium]|nr:MAG: tRNA dihydrouridine synthase DusB [Verrucomicrobiota bacterium]